MRCVWRWSVSHNAAMTLLSLTLALEGAAEAVLPKWTGSSAQAWFLDWLRTTRPEMAALLHDGAGRKPYTVSPLLTENSQHSLRITTLSEALSEQIEALSAAQPPRAVRLGSALFSVRDIGLYRTSYSDLVRAATEQAAPLRLRFITPTSFHSSGLELPLPLPSLVFGSLIHAWNTFSPLPLPLVLREVIHDRLAITSCDVHTRRVHAARRGVRVGFTGQATFTLRADRSDGVGVAPADLASAERLLSALIRYADYAGVGVQTGAGMGQTRQSTAMTP